MINKHRVRRIGVIGVAGVFLCTLSDSRPAAADDDVKKLLDKHVPQGIQDLVSDASDIIGAFSAVSGAVDVGLKLAELTGLLSTGPDPVTLEFQQLNAHLDAIAGELEWKIDEVAREKRYSDARADLTNANEVLKATGQPLPLAATAQVDSTEAVYEAENAESFVRHFTDKATDGRWKQLMPDRPVVTQGLVYDWRFGVPALLQQIKLRIQMMAAVDPSFRTDGVFRDELIDHRQALFSQIATMNDGVRCLDSIGHYQDDGYCTYDDQGNINNGCLVVTHTPVCADIYTGTAAYGDPFIWQDSDPNNPALNAEWYQKNIQTPLEHLRQQVLAQLPLRQMYSVAKSLLTYENIPGEVMLTGGYGWDTIGVAASDSADGFTSKNIPLADFTTWAQSPGVSALSADFNRDGRPDIALVGGPGWGSMPIAFDNGDGTFHYANSYIPDFYPLANQPGVQSVAGDFNGDGYADVAFLGVAGWQSIAIELGNGDGSFSLQNRYLDRFPDWAASSGVTAVSGDFNNDGLSDIALVGHPGWRSIPVAFSNGDGTFSWTNADVDTIPYLASLPNVQPVAGDFNNDGTTDIALMGGSGWSSVPIAFSVGDADANFSFDNAPSAFAWLGGANLPGGVAVGGDFNNDGVSDLAVVGYNRNMMSFGLSDSQGNFSFHLSDGGGFPLLATFRGAIVVGSAHPAQRR